MKEAGASFLCILRKHVLIFSFNERSEFFVLSHHFWVSFEIALSFFLSQLNSGKETSLLSRIFCFLTWTKSTSSDLLQSPIAGFPTYHFHFHGRNFIENFQTRENDEFLKEIEFFHFGFESCLSSMNDKIIVKCRCFRFLIGSILCDCVWMNFWAC
jgi:hypothetical protein